MNLFDDDNIKPKPKGQKSPQSGNNCDIFEPSVYEPDNSKFRADYINNIIPEITAELDDSLIGEEVEEGVNEPGMDLEVSGSKTKRHFKFKPKYLRGPRGPQGFNGSVDNFVVLSETEYSRLRVKDPNKFYYVYEGSDSVGYIEDGVFITGDPIIDGVLVTNKVIQDKVLIL